MIEELVYVLLDRPLPASVTPYLLGRVVLDPEDPLDRYVPENPRIKHRYFTDLTELGISPIWRLAGFQEDAVKPMRAPKNDRIITRSLLQHQRVFDQIYASDAPGSYRTELLQMLSSAPNQGVGYFVTSIRLVDHGEVGSAKEPSSGWTASAGSANTLVDSFHGLSAVNPAFNSRNRASESIARDLTIIAIAYRLVEAKKPLLPILNRPIKIKLGGPMKVKLRDQIPLHTQSKSQAQFLYVYDGGDEPTWSSGAEQRISDTFKRSLTFFTENFRIIMQQLLKNIRATIINRVILFFTSAFYELMDELEILERPLSPGKKRVRWRCICGQKFYCDFTEYRQGTLEHLQSALQYPPRRSRPATYGSENTGSGTADDRFAPASSGARKGLAEFLQNQSTNPTRSDRSDKSPVTSNAPKDGKDIHNEQYAGDPKWIYLCFRDYENIDHDTYIAVAPPVPESGDDFELFNLFRDEYFKRRSNFFFTTLLWQVTRIKFVQFTYAFNGTALITKENVWPPENMCRTWIYDPMPAEEQYHPLTDGKYMLQLFRHPHQSVLFQASMKIKLPILFLLRNVIMGVFKMLKIKIVPPNADPGLPDYEAIDGPDFTDEEPADTPRRIIEKSKWVYLSTPKKAGERLVQNPSKPPEGWGLKFEEDLVIPRLMRITFWYFFFASWLAGVVGGTYLLYFVSITYAPIIATTIAVAGSVLALVNYFSK